MGFHGEEDGGLGWILAGWSRRGSRRRWKLLGVCLIILYTRVFSANMQDCTVCLLNTVFPFKKNEGSVGSSFLEASWWACMRVFRKKKCRPSSKKHLILSSTITQQNTMLNYGYSHPNIFTPKFWTIDAYNPTVMIHFHCHPESFLLLRRASFPIAPRLAMGCSGAPE